MEGIILSVTGRFVLVASAVWDALGKVHALCLPGGGSPVLADCRACNVMVRCVVHSSHHCCHLAWHSVSHVFCTHSLPLPWGKDKVLPCLQLLYLADPSHSFVPVAVFWGGSRNTVCYGIDLHLLGWGRVSDLVGLSCVICERSCGTGVYMAPLRYGSWTLTGQVELEKSETHLS